MKIEFALERYKYVLEQKKRLNEATFKVAAFYQAVLLVILGAQFSMFEKASGHQISLDLAVLGSWGLFIMTVFLSFICIATLVSGISAWLSYRAEEAAFEGQHMTAARPRPSIRDIYRWYETYIILSIFLVAIAYGVALKVVILPAFS